MQHIQIKKGNLELEIQYNRVNKYYYKINLLLDRFTLDTV